MKESKLSQFLGKTHPTISTRTPNQILTEWSNLKSVYDAFPKEIKTFTRRESKGRFYYYRPNNYAIKIPLIAKCSLDETSEKLFKKVPLRNWVKYEIYNYHGTTVELTTRAVIIYLTERQTRLVSCKDDVDKIESSIQEKIMDVGKRFQKEFKAKLDMNNWNWYRKEIGLIDDKLKDISPDVLIHDDIFKKVYEKETEFYDPVYVKNYISNRSLEDLSPFIAQELRDIKIILAGFQKENLAISNAILLIAQTLKKLEEKS